MVIPNEAPFQMKHNKIPATKILESIEHSPEVLNEGGLVDLADALHVEHLLELGGLCVRHQLDVLLHECLQRIVRGHHHLQRYLCPCHALEGIGHCVFSNHMVVDLGRTDRLID